MKEEKKNKYSERSSIGHNLNSYIIYHSNEILDQQQYAHTHMQYGGVCDGVL